MPHTAKITALALLTACAPIEEPPQTIALTKAAQSTTAGSATSPQPQPDAGPAADSGTNTDTNFCPDGHPRGTAQTTNRARTIASTTPSPEGVTVCPNGETFLALDPSGEIWHVPLTASPERWATLGDRRPAGITCDDRNRLFVATFSSKSGKAISLGPVLITSKDAEPIELPQPQGAPPIAGLNGIVAADGVGVYMSDTNNSNILLAQETDEGVFETREVARDVTLANGLAYAPSTRKLYANASGAWQLLQFDVAADGALGQRKSIDVPFMFFMDGVAVDELGELYVADWLGGNVIRIGTGRSVARVANPASLAFRGGTLLITDYKLGDAQQEGGLYAVDLGVCGP
jgi:hypothetical protein